jgi:hypothetical protein
MTEREILLCRIAATYVMGQMGDLKSAFEDEEGNFDFNGEIVDSPTENEFEALLAVLQS